MDQIRQLELENMKSDLPAFNAGDTVDVHYLIREGDKERIQIFSGTVIKISGTGVRRTFLVRRLVAGQGVERLFPLHSPRVKDIVVTARGKARRARLYYLRDLRGKKARLRTKLRDLSALISEEEAEGPLETVEPEAAEPAAAEVTEEKEDA